MDNATRYFTKVTNRELYKYVNIMEYVNDSYVITNKISDKNLREMRINMDDNDAVEFDKFIERNWGKQALTGNIPETVSVGVEESEEKRRGRPKKTI